jgi:chromosome segregation ATPase
MNQPSNIEERINALESWQKTLIHQGKILLFVATVAGLFFQFQSCKVNDKIANLNKQIEASAKELAEIEKAAKAAAQIADRAIIKAGDLQEAVGASQRASSQAAQHSQEAQHSLTEIKETVVRIEASSMNAEASSKKAMDLTEATQALLTKVQEAVGTASNAAQRAEAIAFESDKKFRQLDTTIDDMITRLTALAATRQETRTQQPQDEEPKVILVNISAMRSKVTLREGSTSLRRVNLTSMDYEGTVYVPKGYSAVVKCTAMDSTIFISSELKGRVTVNDIGMRNRIVELK